MPRQEMLRRFRPSATRQVATIPGMRRAVLTIIDKPSSAVHGQIFMDNVNISQSDRNIAATGKPREQEYTGFSVLRLSATGSLYENINYVFMVDFAGGLNNVVTSSGNLGTTP